MNDHLLLGRRRGARGGGSVGMRCFGYLAMLTANLLALRHRMRFGSAGSIRTGRHAGGIALHLLAMVTSGRRGGLAGCRRLLSRSLGEHRGNGQH